MLGDFLLSKKKMDQRICIKLCVKNKMKCSKAIEMMTVAFGESTLVKKHVYKWYKRFTEGIEGVNDYTASSVNVKVLLTVFFDYNGVVHREFLPEGPMVNKEYYIEIMRPLREEIRKNARICRKTSFGCSHFVAYP